MTKTPLISLAAVPMVLVILFVAVISPPDDQDNTNAADCGTGTVTVPAKAKPWITETAKTSGLPQAWLAAVASRESDFDPIGYTGDANGGTWSIYQLNREEWAKVYPPARGSAASPPPGITDPMTAAHYAGIYFKNRLATVRSMKKQNPTKPFAKLPDLDALVLAHNAGEGGGLMAYPHIPAITKSYLAEIRKNYQPQPCTAAGNPGDNGQSGKDTYGPYWASTAGRADGVDPWLFKWGECVSYAAWMVRTISPHKDFVNNWHGAHFGNAQEWAAAARQAKITTDKKPAAGAVAQRMSGTYGHVAYITKVNANGTFDVNEYNFAAHHKFGVRKNVRIGNQFDWVLHFEQKGPTS